MGAETELFPAASVAMDSPKLAWLKSRGLITWRTPGLVGDEESPETGEPIKAWTCMSESALEDGDLHDTATGDTEHEACANYAIKHAIPLWNEATKEPARKERG